MQYTVLGSAPERPREGMIAYANGTTWNPFGRWSRTCSISGVWMEEASRHSRS